MRLDCWPYFASRRFTRASRAAAYSSIRTRYATTNGRGGGSRYFDLNSSRLLLLYYGPNRDQKQFPYGWMGTAINQAFLCGIAGVLDGCNPAPRPEAALAATATYTFCSAW